MRARIWAWMVTSRAVVGSSAMSREGLAERATAIMARWRMPPESSKGYWSTRRLGLAMPTRSSRWMARSRASCLETSSWARMASMMWLPMV